MDYKEIASKEFERNAFGSKGYRAEEVDAYLRDVSVSMKQLEDEKADLMKKLQILAEKVEEYRQDEASLKDALLGAQKMGSKTIAEAKAKAEEILAAASLKSQGLLSEAKDESERLTVELRQQVENEKDALQKMKKEVSDFKANLLALYKNHLDVITTIPEVKPEKPVEPDTTEPEPVAEAPATEEVETPVEEVSSQSNEPEKTETVEPTVPSQATPKREGFMKDTKSFEEKFGELRFGRNSPRETR